MQIFHLIREYADMSQKNLDKILMFEKTLERKAKFTEIRRKRELSFRKVY